MECRECNATHAARCVVLTGGPDGGRTAILELIRQSFCRHVRVLPAAAAIVSLRLSATTIHGSASRRTMRDLPGSGRPQALRLLRNEPECCRRHCGACSAARE